MRRKFSFIIIVFVAAVMLAQEISYAQIAAACMAARRVRKARQEQKSDNNQNNFAKKDAVKAKMNESSAANTAAPSEKQLPIEAKQ